MEKKYLNAVLRKSGEKIEFVATDETLDRQGEVIPLDSWDFSEFVKSPRLLVDHDYKVRSIVGIAANLRREGKQIIFEPVFHDITELARETREMVEQGFLNTVSVGFQQQLSGNTTINKLLEISMVAVPANPSARRLSVKDIDGDTERAVEEFVEKGAVADVLNADRSWAIIEGKYKNLDDVYEIVGALCAAYMYPATPVDQFVPLLNEAVGFLQQIAEGTYEKGKAPAEGATGVAGAIGKAVPSEVLTLAIKAGRVLSDKNRTLISDTVASMKTSIAALDELLNATDPAKSHGKEIAKPVPAPVEKVEKAEVDDEKEYVVMDKEMLGLIRDNLRVNDKHNELTLAVLNRLLKP